MKILSNILVKAGIIVDNYIAIGTDSPYAGYNIDSRGSHNFGNTSTEVYHYFQSSSVNGGSALSVYANNTNANSSRSHIMLADTAASVPTRFGLGVYTGVDPYAYLDSASKLVINNASGANVIIGGVTDNGSKLQVNGDVTASNFVASAYVIANTVWVNGAFKNNNNGNMSLAFSGTTLQLTTDYGAVLSAAGNGNVTMHKLAGSGTRMVVADANGLLSTQSFSANVNAFTEYTYTATAGQTTFAATYTVGQLLVYYNGSKLEPAEYTATDGTSIVITPGVNAGDIIDIIAYQTGAGIGYGSLSATGPLTYNNTTGAFGIELAGSSKNGYLSSTDWNTFNNKQNALSGTGFVKISGTTISYDNTSYLALTGGTVSGTITANSLTVSHPTSSSYITLNTTVSSVNSSQIYFNKGGSAYWDLGAFNIGAAGSNDFSLYNRTTSSNAITVLAATGRVGFGTVSPLSNIHILNGGGNGAEIYASFGSTSIYSEFVHNAFGGAVNLRRESDGQTNTILRAYGNSSLNAVTGNVMIGTTTDNGYKLQVNGNVSSSGGLYPTTGTFGSGILAGRLSSNVSGTTYCLLARLDQDAGWIARGTVVCASWTVWNVSDVYIRKAYASTAVTATISGVSKSGQDFAIVDINYGGARYLAFKFSGGNGEVDVNLTGFGLASYLNMVTSGVTENSTIASY